MAKKKNGDSREFSGKKNDSVKNRVNDMMSGYPLFGY